MLYESIRRLEVAGEKLLHVGVWRWWEFALRVRTTSLRESPSEKVERIELNTLNGEMRRTAR
jgi:hypothetical protein